MVAPSGPSKEVWERMNRGEKVAYVAMVSVGAVLLAAAVLLKVLGYV